jgi:hypothetical protein
MIIDGAYQPSEFGQLDDLDPGRAQPVRTVAHRQQRGLAQGQHDARDSGRQDVVGAAERAGGARGTGLEGGVEAS